MSARPDRHTQRYDRQLRLWNKSGQTALESAHVLLVGASALSSQILKNLVLPGLGTFTICDDARVSQSDVASNFFLSQESVGQFYANELAHFVSELNPATTAHACTKSPSWLQGQEPAFFAAFSLIVCVRQPRNMADSIADLVWQLAPSVPVMYIESSGFQGYVCISLGELGIIETHPESLVDLRLTRPFPALAQFARDHQVDPSDSLAVSHIPYVVLLLRALDAWKASHDGAFPAISEKKDFAHALASQRPSIGDSENFDEAVAALPLHVWRPLQSPAVPAHVTALLDDSQCRKVSTGTSSPFWLLVAALRAFVQRQGVLPLSGSMPDMKATSIDYVALRHVYMTQASADLALFRQLLADVLDKAGMSLEAAGLDDETIKTFVKHAPYLHLVRGRRLRLQRVEPNVGALSAALADPVNPVTAQFYLAFMAAHTFFEHANRFPGQPPVDSSAGYDWNDDIDKLYEYARAYAKNICLDLLQQDQDRLYDACYEVTRGAYSDTPSTAAFLGGLAAQEAIKVMTVQYLPLDNTCVYDGIVQAVNSFRL